MTFPRFMSACGVSSFCTTENVAAFTPGPVQRTRVSAWRVHVIGVGRRPKQSNAGRPEPAGRGAASSKYLLSVCLVEPAEALSFLGGGQ